MNISFAAPGDRHERPVRFYRLFGPAAITACLLLTAGCAQRVYGPPPPPAFAPSPLISQADSFGFRTGVEDGRRDLATGRGYHPRSTRSYAQTPGYDPGMGPYRPYRDAFRRAYLRGYADGFRGR